MFHLSDIALVSLLGLSQFGLEQQEFIITV